MDAYISASISRSCSRLVMLYFAYGSNMDWDQIHERCPSARFVCTAKAVGYRLAFTRFSTKRQCGAADIVQSDRDEVWGAVFQIDETDIRKLDESEGYHPNRPREMNAYEPTEIQVLRDGGEYDLVTVRTYTVVKKLNPNPKPSVQYKRLMIDGARHSRLPPKYIEELERIETQ